MIYQPEPGPSRYVLKSSIDWHCSKFSIFNICSISALCSPQIILTRSPQTEVLIILNSKAHIIWPKTAQKGAQFFFLKKSHIFGKRRTIFDPPKFFIAFLCIYFLKMSNFEKKSVIFLFFFNIFP